MTRAAICRVPRCRPWPRCPPHEGYLPWVERTSAHVCQSWSRYSLGQEVGRGARAGRRGPVVAGAPRVIQPHVERVHGLGQARRWETRRAAPTPAAGADRRPNAPQVDTTSTRGSGFLWAGPMRSVARAGWPATPALNRGLMLPTPTRPRDRGNVVGTSGALLRAPTEPTHDGEVLETEDAAAQRGGSPGGPERSARPLPPTGRAGTPERPPRRPGASGSARTRLRHLPPPGRGAAREREWPARPGSVDQGWRPLSRVWACAAPGGCRRGGGGVPAWWGMTARGLTVPAVTGQRRRLGQGPDKIAST